jgi:hypothetical protein
MMRIIRLAGGFVFGILSGAYAFQMTASKWHPDRQIGAFGIMWSLALIAYFSWGLAQKLRHPPLGAADSAQSVR